MADVGLQFVELVGDTEEERTVDFIYGTTFGNGETVVRLAQTHFIAGVDLVADDADFRGFHNTLHKEGASSYQTHLNGDGEVEDDGEEEGDEQYQDVAFGIVHQILQRAPSAHIIADDDQYGRKAGHGDILRIRHENEQDKQEH